MEKSVSNTKRLVTNTAFMYIRMIVLMCISLYTSRIVLKELGVVDFGIYNLVGSIVAMFASVRTLFSSSVQRFLNFEMGKKNFSSLPEIFDTSIYLNIFIAVIFVIAVEILGVWFLSGEINIDSSRLFAAQIVFQLSLLSAVIGIFTTSYDAAIIAHERMNFYAYLSILEGILRLSIVFLLQIFNYDKLVLYGILTCIVSFIVLYVNYIYCKRKFEECSFTYKLNRSYLKKMTGFAGWNFFGVSAYTLTQNGLNMVLNIFGGAIVNAARGLTYQISSVLTNFMSNISIVINPYGVKLYSAGEINAFFKLFYFSSKILFLLQCCVVLTVSLFANEMLVIWLTEVPMYTEVFLKLVLVNSVVRSLHSPLDLLFKASGKLKLYQLFEGLTLSMPLVASFFLLKKGFPYESVFLSIILFEIINLMIILILARKISALSLTNYFIKILFPCILIAVIGSISYYYAYNGSSLLKFTTLLFSIVSMIICFIFFMESYEKVQIKNIFVR